jgi:hypothetical protein
MRRINSALLAGIGGVAALAIVGIAAILLTSGGRAPDRHRQDADALRAYTVALRGPTAAAGQVVEQDMKPSLADFRAGRLEPAAFAERARSWQLSFRRTRQQLDAISPPPSVSQARPLFDGALDAYFNAAATLEQAAGAEAGARNGLVDEAVATARQADRTYNQAAAVVQAALRAAGLPPDPDLPDLAPSVSP